MKIVAKKAFLLSVASDMFFRVCILPFVGFIAAFQWAVVWFGFKYQYIQVNRCLVFVYLFAHFCLETYLNQHWPEATKTSVYISHIKEGINNQERAWQRSSSISRFMLIR